MRKGEINFIKNQVEKEFFDKSELFKIKIFLERLNKIAGGC